MAVGIAFGAWKTLQLRSLIRAGLRSAILSEAKDLCNLPTAPGADDCIGPSARKMRGPQDDKVRLWPRNLFHVPAADFYGRFRCSQFAAVIGGRDLAFLPGQQGNVVVFPDDGKNFLSASPLVDFQTHEECQALAGVLEGDMRDRVLALVFGAVRDFSFTFGSCDRR